MKVILSIVLMMLVFGCSSIEYTKDADGNTSIKATEAESIAEVIDAIGKAVAALEEEQSSKPVPPVPPVSVSE